MQAHATDLIQVYGAGQLQDSLINFVTNLDPNGPTLLRSWPKYATSSPQLFTSLDGLIPVTITQDTYRDAAINFAMQLILQFGV